MSYLFWILGVSTALVDADVLSSIGIDPRFRVHLFFFLLCMGAIFKVKYLSKASGAFFRPARAIQEVFGDSNKPVKGKERSD
jgi:hypothetical protein